MHRVIEAHFNGALSVLEFHAYLDNNPVNVKDPMGQGEAVMRIHNNKKYGSVTWWRHRSVTGIASILILLMTSTAAHAWGDEGHEVVALIANHYLTASTRQKVNALLSGDASGLTAKSIAEEATWADKYRDSDRNTTKERYNATRQWHFVDIEIQGGDLDTACFGHPVVPSGALASQADAKDCVVDKIDQFSKELADPTTSAEEKRLALQFLLHFVGDVHQPLHASDDHDQGGNAKKVKADGIATNKLHHYWDTEFVKRLGTDSQRVARNLVSTITPGQVKAWQKGDASSWAQQSYAASKLRVYGGLGAPDASGKYTLSAAYVKNATNTVSRQLSRAGVRLANVLNTAMQ